MIIPVSWNNDLSSLIISDVINDSNCSPRMEIVSHPTTLGRIMLQAYCPISFLQLPNWKSPNLDFLCQEKFWFIALGFSAAMIPLVYACVKFCNSYSHDRVHRGFSIKLNSEVKFSLRITECQADKTPERFSFSFFPIVFFSLFAFYFLTL